MARLVRKCSQCGTVDQRQAWPSLDDATKKGAFEQNWTCASCAWTEFELVEAEQEPAQA